ncbi:MAG: exosome complex exonuclease Rrp41 [Candidatus Thermoplasmatota archaeon]|nr:exosome complex exonuclease Rrp41 [Euryarchaeota archaeon]MBU4031429.1 exosome complex exonuclease Rrp41 [Candidatus Thermoplasmatota archaeon]MBU4071094.1 exosome complex exonuclease Rrp41 [Candidatus Thermoplasmatota archaeon]MBU4144976.1 exosome complex exonuclease Rrp41 [Candidatus Thermoplasmatota archaeon]MBU4591118.1 exosome complex exonuclease Rrp41 [Candidatus Thermoplasmatota archaeon]
MSEDIVLLNSDGLRVDGRALDELRPIKIEAGVLGNADGSAYVEWGANKVLAAVYGPKEAQPKYLQDTAKAIVQVNYNMAAFSGDERVRPGPNRRATEISKITAEALENVILTNQFPRASIDVYIEVLEADAGTRCAGLTAASVAIADAGIPMIGMVAACAAGKIDGHIALDLGKKEDNFGQADMPLGYVPGTGEIVLLQMDGHMTMVEFRKAMDMAISACEQIHELQIGALRRRYAVNYADMDDGGTEQ